MLFKGPADIAVEEVHAILRQIVARTIAGEECKQLAQYTQLKREIATCAANALEAMKEEARKMVLTLVEMERSYLTAEVFKEILQQNGRSESGEVIRTLSGRQARPCHRRMYNKHRTSRCHPLRSPFAPILCNIMCPFPPPPPFLPPPSPRLLAWRVLADPRSSKAQDPQKKVQCSEKNA